MSKNLDEQVDKLEAAIDPNTVISVGGINFTPAKIMIAGGILSTVLGGLYGAFEVYKDYMDMKAQIQEYVAPDLSGLQEQLSVMDANMKKLQESVIEARDYTRDIKMDLKNDIERIESIVDKTESRVKESESTVRQMVNDTEKNTRIMIDNASQRFDNKRDQLSSDTDRKLNNLETELNKKLQRALDNPLAN